MRRHDLDPVALVSGVAFAGLGLLALLQQGDLLGARWVLPVLLIAVGAAGLLASRLRSRN